MGTLPLSLQSPQPDDGWTAGIVRFSGCRSVGVTKALPGTSTPMLENPAPVPRLLRWVHETIASVCHQLAFICHTALFGVVLSIVSLTLMAISLLPLFANTSLLLLFSAVGFYTTSLPPAQPLEGGLLHPASAALAFCLEGD